MELYFELWQKHWLLLFLHCCESLSVVCNSLRPHRLYSPWNSPGQNTGMGSLSLLQEIFPTQGLNWGLLHCRWILYRLSHQGSPNGREFEETPGDGEGQRSLASRSAVHGVAKSRTWLSDWTTANLVKKKLSFRLLTFRTIGNFHFSVS